jgi:subtilisin family serine protease
MTARRPVPGLCARALFAALLTLVLVPGIAAAGGPGSARAGGGPDHLSGRFATVSDAVAAGVVDAQVARDLAVRGRADALVTFDASAALLRAESVAPRGPGRAEAILRYVRPAFADQKRKAFGAPSQVSVLRDWLNLATAYVRIRSTGSLLQMLQSPGVTGVRENRRYQRTLDQSLPLIGRVDSLGTLINPGAIGTGTSVAVLDTGVDYSRSAFGACGSGPAPADAADCRVAFAEDFAADDFQLDDGAPTCSGGGACHGTNVAAIVLGVAPGTRILALDVFEGSTTSVEILNSALDWVVGHQAAYNIRAANLSLGDQTYHRTTCWDSPEEPPFASLRAAGVLPVVASGNWADLGPSGAYTDGIASPACTAGAISVGAVYDANVGPDPFGCGDATTAPNKITCFSQGGPPLSLVAPGALITAAGITMGGTSQATPHVAGAAAVLAAAKPGATPYQIQQILRTSGPSVVDSRGESPVSVRRLSLPAALAAAVPLQEMWAEPALTAGAEATWSYGSSLARTGSTLHNVHMRWSSAFDPKLQVEYLRSTNGGSSWKGGDGTATPTLLTKPWDQGSYGAVATSSNYVYAAWTRMTSVANDYVASDPRAIQFRRSPDQGLTWGANDSVLVLSAWNGRVDQPSIAASGASVYVVWTDSNSGAIRLRTSANYGASFGSPRTIGTTAVMLADGSGRWGMPVVAAYGSNLAVVWLSAWNASGNYGTLRALVSSNRAASWVARTLDTDSRDRASVSALGDRIAVAWVDRSATRLQMWQSGTWQPVRTASPAFGSAYTYKSGYAPAVALYPSAGVSVVWSSCRYNSRCYGANMTGGIDLYWRESASNGSTWRTAPRLIASSQQSAWRRANDSADIEYVSWTRRYIQYATWTNAAPYPTRMYIRTGVG